MYIENKYIFLENKYIYFYIPWYVKVYREIRNILMYMKLVIDFIFHYFYLKERQEAALY